MKEKVFLAIGNREFEDYLKSVLSNRYDFVGETTHKGGILSGIQNKTPDIVIIRENLDGAANIMAIIYEIRNNFPDVRIIFMSSQRERGDKFLTTLINYGVYDFTVGSAVNARDIVKLMDVPNKYEDIKSYLPRPDFNETTGEMVFKAPEVKPEIVIKEVVIEENPDKKSKFGLETLKNINITSLLKGGVKEEKKPKEIPKENEKKNSDKLKENIFLQQEQQKKKINTITEEPPETRRELSVIGHKEEPEKPKVQIREKQEVNCTNKEFETRRNFIQVKDYEPAPTNNTIEVQTSDRIISFISGKTGCGATTLALNTSVALAKKGFKVIILEFNSIAPSIAYWMEFGKTAEGIETCFQYIKDYDFAKIPKCITKSSIVKQENSSMRKKYKNLPDTLDFMFFSKRYLANLEEKVDLTGIKDLYIHLMFQMGYDFVILDLPTDFNSPETMNGLIYCNKVFSVITQDVASIGYYLAELYELTKQGINIENKNTFILNQYVDGTKVDKTFIRKWLSVYDLITVNDCREMLINANVVGLPAICLYENNDFEVSIDEIVRKIMTKQY